MRNVVLGRKNWLHVGSLDGGKRAAVLYSVVESCKRLEVPVEEHMKEVRDDNPPLYRGLPT